MTALKTPLIKISATGNDFLLIDLRTDAARAQWNTEFSQNSRAEWTKLICDRHEGLGADGALFLDPDEQLDFRWDFYNSDGGSAEMCGNAARAVCWYAHTLNQKRDFKFLTRAGVVDGHVENQQRITVTLPAIAECDWTPKEYAFVRAGVPHAVVTTENMQDRAALKTVAFTIKQDSRFGRDGVNVTFVKKLSSTQIESVTFERGVEDFTRACGTGAVAAAFSLLRGKEGLAIEVRVPGGQLFVIWNDGRPKLTGPAKVVAEMHWMRS